MGEYTTLNPATGEVIQVFPEINDAEVKMLIDQSAVSYASWSKAALDDRTRVLHKVAQLHREQAVELAGLITLEMGKVTAQALGEIELVASIYEYYAKHLEEFLADEPLQISGPGYAAVRTQAIGPLLGIMPWNFPFYQVARFAAPNIALGNTIILKHSRNCPQSALAIEKIFLEAGLPNHVYQNALISSAQVADIIADPRIQGVSLTGSEYAGAAVAEVAGRNLKKCVLELGGSDPFIVTSTADLDEAAKIAAVGRLGNAGQACTSAKRFLVQSDVYEEFVAKLVEEMSDWPVGDPTNSAHKVGPLSSKSAVKDVQELLDDAIEQGATALLEGGAIEGAGSYFQPALLSGVTPKMRAYKEEIFGPVGVVHSFSTIDEAIDLANDSPYGLSSSVFTGDPFVAERFVDELETGMVWINSFGKSAADIPFGGVKLSGYGRELGKFGFNEFANKKLVRNVHGSSTSFEAGFTTRVGQS
ncbi:MAG: NAD-dependent succinate-semialdehyde dehydrogenase [Corynebacterium glutamicum]|nr:NAD-dependent succinate-semialdehyde dehydrogenase [Corynebacterium glutamicum]